MRRIPRFAPDLYAVFSSSLVEQNESLDYEKLLLEHQNNSTSWTDASFEFPESITWYDLPQFDDFFSIADTV